MVLLMNTNNVICSHCHSTNVIYIREKMQKHLFSFFKRENKWATYLYRCQDCGKQFNHIVKKEYMRILTINEIFDKYNVSVKSGLLKNGSARLFNAETNKPISTDKQIISAYENYIETLKYKENPIVTKDDEILNYILPIFSLGILYYRLGKWDNAENEWLKLVGLMPHVVDKLCILYRKEKRYLDVIYVLYKANSNENNFIDLYKPVNYKDSIINAIELYKKHINDDESCYVNAEWLHDVNLI